MIRSIKDSILNLRNRIKSNQRKEELEEKANLIFKTLMELKIDSEKAEVFNIVRSKFTAYMKLTKLSVELHLSDLKDETNKLDNSQEIRRKDYEELISVIFPEAVISPETLNKIMDEEYEGVTIKSTQLGGHTTF